jgi:DNA-binding MarR family transcriptional regulator
VAALGVERRTAVRDLRALEARGLVASLGATTDRRYVLRRTDP